MTPDRDTYDDWDADPRTRRAVWAALILGCAAFWTVLALILIHTA